MKTALLLCDEVNPEFVSGHGTYSEMFQRLLKIPMDEFEVFNHQFPASEDYDAFICTGSRKSVYDNEPWIVKLLSYIREVNTSQKMFVGICFGHQALAQALGGKVEKATAGWLIGVHSFTLTQAMDSFVEFNVLMLCQDQVTKLPTDASVLATSQSCPNGMFQLGNNMLGIQGHPEFTKAYNQAVFESRKDRIPEKVRKVAHESMHKDPDTDFLSNLITSFLEQ
ncbi:MAG: amidotransferase [Cyclobacteriaceae bacterium]